MANIVDYLVIVPNEYAQQFRDIELQNVNKYHEQSQELPVSINLTNSEKKEAIAFYNTGRNNAPEYVVKFYESEKENGVFLLKRDLDGYGENEVFLGYFNNDRKVDKGTVQFYKSVISHMELMVRTISL